MTRVSVEHAQPYLLVLSLLESAKGPVEATNLLFQQCKHWIHDMIAWESEAAFGVRVPRSSASSSSISQHNPLSLSIQSQTCLRLSELDLMYDDGRLVNRLPVQDLAGPKT